ncbi:serine/threonine-protein kinase Wnk-like [Drosophila montana]|uniref:serine/threonine-protein kinase Wnk-like n=1 Tax=Drosophila montana TaxID=40370 RepID=UPI00313CC5EA
MPDNAITPTDNETFPQLEGGMDKPQAEQKARNLAISRVQMLLESTRSKAKPRSLNLPLNRQMKIVEDLKHTRSLDDLSEVNITFEMPPSKAAKQATELNANANADKSKESGVQLGSVQPPGAANTLEQLKIELENITHAHAFASAVVASIGNRPSTYQASPAIASMKGLSAQLQQKQQQQTLQLQSHLQQQPQQTVTSIYNQQQQPNFQVSAAGQLLQQAPLVGQPQQTTQAMQHVLQPLFNPAVAEATHPHLLPSDIQSDIKHNLDSLVNQLCNTRFGTNQHQRLLIITNSRSIFSI